MALVFNRFPLHFLPDAADRRERQHLASFVAFPLLNQIIDNVFHYITELFPFIHSHSPFALSSLAAEFKVSNGEFENAQKHLQKGQRELAGEAKMSSDVVVSNARNWADTIVMREYQGPGQMERAMERASQKTGIDYSILWSLRYRPPKDVWASVYLKLKCAYEDEVARQTRLYEHERAVLDATDTKMVRAADAVAGRNKEALD